VPQTLNAANGSVIFFQWIVAGQPHVNNPDYQPWLVERRRLFAAVNTLDGDKKRGLLLIE
jgi:hypothetical protein